MREIYLTQGKVTQVDFEWLMRYTRLDNEIWYAVRSKYINGKYYHITMHREILMLYNVKAPFDIDHKDGNGLNNQKYNLRAATRSQNQANRGLNKNNSSGYKGVYFQRSAMKFKAQIGYKGEKIYLGLFEDPINAAVKYNEYAKRLFKEYAQLNFPE
jgi:hypothetical protein